MQHSPHRRAMADWDNLRIFLAVARSESLSGAALALKIDAATVGRRIARLEGDLGQPLFLRSASGYTLTETGEKLVGHAEAMEQTMRLVPETVQGSQSGLGGLIRIGAPDGCAAYVLPGVIAELARKHPKLEVQIISLPRIFNLTRREADIAIAVSRPQTGARLTVRKISDYRLSLAAHRDYITQNGPFTALAEVAQKPLVGYIPDMIFDRELDYLAEVTSNAPTLASNSVPVQLALLQHGIGIGIAHDFALPFFPDLQKVLPDKFALTRSFWMVRHMDDRSPRMDRFARLLSESMRNEITRLEGLS